MEKCYLQNGVYKKTIHIVALYFFERTFMSIKILEFLGSILNFYVNKNTFFWRALPYLTIL
jgi:hypothetical protein